MKISLLPPLQLTGPLKEKFRQLKIKVNADHAGPSQLLLPLNLLMPSKKEPSLTYLNNNWLIAQAASEIWDAMED